MYLVRAPCKKTDRSVGMSLDKYEYIIIIIIMCFQYRQEMEMSIQKPIIISLIRTWDNDGSDVSQIEGHHCCQSNQVEASIHSHHGSQVYKHGA